MYFHLSYVVVFVLVFCSRCIQSFPLSCDSKSSQFLTLIRRSKSDWLAADLNRINSCPIVSNFTLDDHFTNISFYSNYEQQGDKCREQGSRAGQEIIPIHWVNNHRAGKNPKFVWLQWLCIHPQNTPSLIYIAVPTFRPARPPPVHFPCPNHWHTGFTSAKPFFAL